MSPLLFPGSANNVWWVNSTGGVDAGGTAGQNREKPLATFAQANTNAAAGDFIVLMDGHTETGSTAAVTISKAGLKIIGAGSAAGVPTVSFAFGVGGIWSVTGAAVELRNIKFKTRTGADATSRVSFQSAAGAVRGCYFECGPNDTGMALEIAGGGPAEITGCTFISTATSTAAQPSKALGHSIGVSDVLIQNCKFSDGTVGFSNIYCLDLSGFAMTRLRLERLSFLLGAEGKNHASTTGYAIGTSVTGGGKLLF